MNTFKINYQIIGILFLVFIVVIAILSCNYLKIRSDSVKKLPFNYVTPFKKGSAGVYVDGKWGIISSKGEYIIEPSSNINNVEPVKNGYIVIKNYLFGYIDHSGNTLIEPKYTKIESFENYLKVYKDTQVELFNYDGKVIVDSLKSPISSKYNRGNVIGLNDEKYHLDIKDNNDSSLPSTCTIGEFKDGLAYFITMNNEVGYIDKSYKVVIKPKTSLISQGDYINTDIDHNFNGGSAIIYNKNKDDKVKVGLINKKGEYLLEPEYDWICPFSDGLALIVKNQKYGYINKSGKFIIPLEFKEVDNTNCYSLSFNENLAPFKIGDKWGYINKKGIVAIKPRFESFKGIDDTDVMESFNKGVAVVRINDEIRFIDVKGNYVSAKNYEPRHFEKKDYFFSNGLAALSINYSGVENIVGYVNERGKFVIPPIFSEAKEFNNGFAFVKKGEKWGVINKKGEFVVKLRYDEISGCNGKGIVSVKLDNKWGLLDKAGKIIIKPVYDYISNFDGYGIATIKLKNKWGLINKAGKVIIKPEFEAVKVLSQNCVAVEVDNLWEIRNRLNEPINKMKFKRVDPFSEGYAVVMKDQRWGFIDESGKIMKRP